jgi:cellulose synthase/poly-beta-1,6-N-acetylglucosamine synthase-like glycosyltransferase
MLESFLLIIKIFCTFLVFFSTLPLVMSLIQFGVIGLHRFFTGYEKLTEYFPQVAIIVPAWNEAPVLSNTVDQLMSLEYPPESLRVYVVDDASTDNTPEVMAQKMSEYPGNVFHLRREKGGQGKAHTLNHGIDIILKDDWCEALLIMDADVLFEKDSLRKMARHLSDKTLGAVTAYIKEGSQPGNYMTKFISFEYITAQAASRRAQNIFGAMACLAGGAQLHTRENLLAIGGAIDTSSLAEDTFTTFKTQLNGRRVFFEGNAVVWAEEPADILGLWKQRLRWARGNVQVTIQFWRLWFNTKTHQKLGGTLFGLNWFSIFLMPIFMISGSIGLLTLFFVDFPLSWALFKFLWIMSAITYIFVTFLSFAIDVQSAKYSWKQGILFPGAISLTLICYSMYPPLFEIHIYNLLVMCGFKISEFGIDLLILFMYAWIGTCMAVAYLAKWIEKIKYVGFLAQPFVYIAGFGPLLCAIIVASYILEARGAEMKWDKTEKSGKVGIKTS